MVKEFADQSLLKLIMLASVRVWYSQHNTLPLFLCEVDGSILPADGVGKCVGYRWTGDLSATRSVEENIQKAHSAFFHFGSIGVFQGDISPLSSREVHD